MYLARILGKKPVKAIVYLNYTEIEKEKMRERLVCVDCGSKVFFASGPVNRAHFRHYERPISGICSMSKKYVYKKKEPQDVLELFEDIGFIDIIGLHKKSKKKGTRRNKNRAEGKQPGEHEKEDELSQNQSKITWPNKIALNLNDLLNFLISDRFRKIDKSLLENVHVNLLGHQLPFNDAIIHIEDIDWHADCGKYVSEFPRIYWGHIYKVYCKDNEEYRYEIKEVILKDRVQYKMVINFGNLNHKRPNLYLNELATTKFLSKFHSQGVNDIKGYLAAFTTKVYPEHVCPKIKMDDFDDSKLSFIKN